MFSTILHKRNSLSGNTPAPSSLSAGELAINVADGLIFTKTDSEEIKTFLNADRLPYTLDFELSSVNYKFGGNTVTGILAGVLGGVDNNVSGAGSTVVNGSDNDIEGDYAFIGNGSNNKILSGGDFGAILGGQNNTLDHQESFILGSNITSHLSGVTYVNSLSATGKIYGDGSQLTGIVAGDSEATTLVRSNSGNWDSVYTSYSTNSASIDASHITSGTLNAARLPVFNGDVITDTSNGSVSSTVVAIQGEPISTQTPNLGQVLQWTGTAWTPGAITTGGSGGGGLIYYLNFANQAQSPTTNLSATPNTPRELGAEGTVAASSVTINNVSTIGYDLICGFVSLTGSPNAVTIPAGLWDFNIWASATSTTTKQTSLLLNVYKYDGSNIPTLLASSGDIFIYDPITTAQYIGYVVFPQTTLLETDRIYIELRAKATQNNRNITIYFGGTTPTHVHTTFPSVRGSGLVKVINGVYQTPASLLVDTDVASNANISQTKINGLTDVADKANSTFTTVQSNSGDWGSKYQEISSNANLQTNKNYILLANNSSPTVTLPQNPAVGDCITLITDVTDNTYIIIDRNRIRYIN